MRQIRTLLLTCVVAVLAASCKEEEGPFLAPEESLAFVRYIHAVPDTGATDWRPIDALANSPPAIALNYRGFTHYQAMGSGARHIRIFLSSTSINVTSVPIIDTTITFAPNTYYSLVWTGFARSGQAPADRLVLIEDKIPDVPAGQVAVRVINLGLDLGSVDVFAPADTSGTTPLPTAPLISGIADGTVSAYTTQTPGSLALRLTATGTRTPVLANVMAPAGQAGDAAQNLTPIGGSRMGGSAFTAFVFRRSATGVVSTPAIGVVGHNFTTPGIVYVIDKHPPR